MAAFASFAGVRVAGDEQVAICEQMMAFHGLQDVILLTHKEQHESYGWLNDFARS
jgi:hypothetical protein